MVRLQEELTLDWHEDHISYSISVLDPSEVQACSLHLLSHSGCPPQPLSHLESLFNPEMEGRLTAGLPMAEAPANLQLAWSGLPSN